MTPSDLTLPSRSRNERPHPWAQASVKIALIAASRSGYNPAVDRALQVKT
jgi:hypothetical protein